MPCDTIQTATVDLGKLDPVLLDLAMADLGLTGRYVYDRAIGKITMRGYGQPTEAQIKQAYSAQVVKQTAKKFGWQIKETGRFQYAVTKR